VLEDGQPTCMTIGSSSEVIKILEIQHQVSINLINYQKIKEPAGKLSITDSITGSKLNNTTGKDQEGAVVGIISIDSKKS
jgi:hypothetical protein